MFVGVGVTRHNAARTSQGIWRIYLYRRIVESAVLLGAMAPPSHPPPSLFSKPTNIPPSTVEFDANSLASLVDKQSSYKAR